MRRRSSALRNPGSGNPYRALILGAVLLTVSGCGSGKLGWVPGISGDEPVIPADVDAEIATLETRATTDGAEPYWPFRIGEIRHAQGRTAEAETSLRQALERHPAHAPSLSLLSKLYYDAGRHDEAIDLLEGSRAQRRLPEVLDVALALHYDAVDEVDIAEELVDSLGGLDWSESGSAVAYLRLRGNDFTASEEVARRALDADDTAVNRNNYGIAKLYAGDPEGARVHFEKALEKDPTLPGPYYNLAIVERFYHFDDDAARDWFRRYRELSDDDPDGLGEILATDMAEGGAE
ncbi:MAG: tetratricopeptide repeat protein [Gemmatimonadetes bacterium]|nr:tetratricopeptide repeat protein [Gemmatimonadota bacterium]